MAATRSRGRPSGSPSSNGSPRLTRVSSPSSRPTSTTSSPTPCWPGPTGTCSGQGRRSTPCLLETKPREPLCPARPSASSATCKPGCRAWVLGSLRRRSRGRWLRRVSPACSACRRRRWRSPATCSGLPCSRPARSTRGSTTPPTGRTSRARLRSRFRGCPRASKSRSAPSPTTSSARSATSCSRLPTLRPRSTRCCSAGLQQRLWTARRC